MQINAKTFDRVYEFVHFNTENPLVTDPSKPFTEGAVGDVPFGQVRSVYPLIHATHSDRLTKNFTYYSKACVVGKDAANPSETTGWRSFVKPYGVPILKEHRSQDYLSEADVPMGRVIYAGYEAYKNRSQTPVSKRKGYQNAGSAEGTGHLVLVPAIVEPDAIEGVLGGKFHTVSIGSHVGKVIESISGKDIAALARNGQYDDMPDYRRGQVYKVDGVDLLSFWKMEEMHGIECSYVNVPADDIAKNAIADIGIEGVQKLLVGEKKPGAKECALYNAKTGQMVESWIPEEGAFDESYTFVDSLEVGIDTWWARSRPSTEAAPAGSVVATESAQDDPVAAITKAIREVKSTMDMKNQILECLKAPETLLGVKEKLEGTSLEAFMTEVSGIAEEKLTAKGIQAVAKVLAEGGKPEGEFSDEALLQKCQEAATAVVDDWNESAASLALTMYTEAGGDYATADLKAAREAALDQPATYGELYALPEGHALYGKESTLTRRALEAMDEAQFAGEGRTFPVTNLESAALAVRMNEETKALPTLLTEAQQAEKQTNLAKMVKAFGLMFGSESALYGVELSVADEGFAAVKQFASVESLEQIESTIENIDAICEGLGLGQEQKEGLLAFLESAKTAAPILFGDKLEELPLVEYSTDSAKPVRLGLEYLFERYSQNEGSGNGDLTLQLLAVCRTRNVSKKEIAEACEGYKHFAPKVLEKLLDKLPAEPKAEPKTESNDTPELKGIANPVAETKTTVEDPKTKDKTPKAPSSWKTEAAKPLRPSGKPVRTKEIK